MNNYLEKGIRQREEIMKTYFEENCKLKDEIKVLNKLLERMRSESKTKRPLTVSSSGKLLVIKVTNLTILDPNKGAQTQRGSLVQLQNVLAPGKQITKRSKAASQNVSPKQSMYTLRVPIVTASQGLKDGNSLFVGHSGKQSILDMSNELPLTRAKF